MSTSAVRSPVAPAPAPVSPHAPEAAAPAAANSNAPSASNADSPHGFAGALNDAQGQDDASSGASSAEETQSASSDDSKPKSKTERKNTSLSAADLARLGVILPPDGNILPQPPTTLPPSSASNTDLLLSAGGKTAAGQPAPVAGTAPAGGQAPDPLAAAALDEKNAAALTATLTTAADKTAAATAGVAQAATDAKSALDLKAASAAPDSKAPSPLAAPDPSATPSSPLTAGALADALAQLQSPTPNAGANGEAKSKAAAQATPAVAADQAPVATAAPLIANPVLAASLAANAGDKDTRARADDSASALTAVGPNGASVTAPLHTNAAGANDSLDPAVFKLNQGLDTPEFSQALVDRVSYMVDKDVSSAKLQINPPQLGPIEVRIEVQGDKAQVWLSAHSVVTRDALESSSPALRDMLSSQGFGQVSVDISQRSFQDRPTPSQRFEWTPSAPTQTGDSLFAESGVKTARAGLGALDAYA